MNSDAIILFYAGIVAQALFLLIGRMGLKDAGQVLACCGISLFGLIPGKHEHVYDPHLHLFMVACIFAIAYACFFKKKVLERINQEILMVWTLVFLYIMAQTPFIADHAWLFIPLAAASLLAVINAFAGFDRYYGWKVYFYVWFLCTIAGILASQFAFLTVCAVFGLGQHPAVIGSFTVFVVGMSFLYLAINLWYVIELIPLPGKHQSFSERMEQVKEDMEILAGDYDAEQIRWWKTLALLIVSASLLTANYFQHFVSDTTLVPVLIAILPVMDKIKPSAKTAVATTAVADAPAANDEPQQETSPPAADN